MARPTVAEEIRHGYTLADLDYLVRGAVFGDLWHRGMDVEERVGIVWLAILDALYEAEQPPAHYDLLRTARAAVDAHVRREMSYAGRPKDNRWTERCITPRWLTYWWDQTRPAPSCETKVVERRALAQIWPRLSQTHRDVLTALAMYEDYQAAATALGKTYGTFQVHVSKARRAFWALWHEGESPRGMWGTDRRADRAGVTAKRKPTNALRRRTGQPRWTAEPVHNAARYANHGCRCDVCTADATRKARQYRRASGTAARRRLTEPEVIAVRRRRDAGESLRAIAADLGFSDSYLSRLLSGVRKPAAEVAA